MADEEAGSDRFLSAHAAIYSLGLAVDSDQPLSIEKLSGGLTNDNVLVTLQGTQNGRAAQAQKKVVIRRSSKKTSQHLNYDRHQEFKNSSIASKDKRIGAPVIGFIPATDTHGGALALEFVEGKTMDEKEIQSLCSTEAGASRLVDALKALHSSPSLFENTFDPFEARIGYEEQVRLLSGTEVVWTGYRSVVHRSLSIQEYLAKDKETTVDCHNDLLSANFLDTSPRITIIDWELSGRAEPSWELGNFISENGLDEDDLAIQRLISSYWIHLTPLQIEVKVKRAKLFSIISKITWAAWGAVLHHLDNADTFNYQEWSMEKLVKADRALSNQQNIEVLCSV